MNDDRRIEFLLEQVLLESASPHAPDRLVPDVASITSHVQQRPVWLLVDLP